MKREATRYVSECDTYRKVKADYMKSGGLLQPLSISESKWDDISMGFIVDLPMTARKFDLIWVIVDRLFKSAHFIPVNTNYKVQKYGKIYIARVLCLHGVLKIIISDRGLQFVRITNENQIFHVWTFRNTSKDCTRDPINYKLLVAIFSMVLALILSMRSFPGKSL
jgi:hypothetical protein